MGLILRVKYSNGKLKVDFDLDITSKSEPVAGPDDLFLLLQHWVRDEHVFPQRTTNMTSPRYCYSNPTRVVGQQSWFTPRRAKLAKTPLGKQKRPIRINDLRSE